MFDFEKLDVYQKAKQFNREVYSFLKNSKTIDYVSKNQLRRASLSIMLNIAEGSSRFSKPDRRNFFVISRGSASNVQLFLIFCKMNQFLLKKSSIVFIPKQMNCPECCFE